MARKSPPVGTTLVAVRLPDTLLARVDHLAERWSRERPGLPVTRSDVVRVLLERGVDAEVKNR